jgi:PPOX class probable F420-dependent enzyme
MASIPDEAGHLFENKDVAHVATLNKDGSPQNSAVWIDREGDLVTFNTTKGYLKARNLERDGRVAISITALDNPYENLLIRGEVAEITPEGAEDQIDRLARRYMGVDTYPYRREGEERLVVKIQPRKVKYDKY